MAEFYLINEDFFVPLHGDIYEDSLELEKGDIIEVRFLRDDSCLVKKVNDVHFFDSHLYHEFIVVNSHIFENITKSYLRDEKLKMLIKKSNK